MEKYKQQLLFLVKKINRYQLIGIVAVILVVSALLRVFTPELPPAETIIYQQSPLVQEVEIHFTDFVVPIPEKIDVLRAEMARVDIDRFAENLARELNYQRIPQLSNTWESTDQTSLVAVESLENLVKYKNFYDPFMLEAVQQLKTKDELKQIFTSFLDTYTDLQGYIITEDVPILVTNEDFEEANDQTANAYRFSVSQLVNDIPLIIGTRRSPLASAVLLTNGDILDITFFPQTITTQVVSNYDSLSLPEISSNIEQGLVSYLLVTTEDSNVISPSALRKITFTQGQLEYRQNEQNGYILPYVRFIGIGTDSAGKTYNVEAISPAVRVAE